MAGAGATLKISALKKRALNKDGFEIQDFRQEILLNGLNSLPSASITTPSTSTIDPYMSTPRTPIPQEYEWIRHTSTPEERAKFFDWAQNKAEEAEKAGDPDECMTLELWSRFVYHPIVVDPPPHIYDRHLKDWAHPTANNAAPDGYKRLLNLAHSTARITAPGECKRWSLQEEVAKPFEIAMNRVQRKMKKNLSYPGDTQEDRIYSYKREPGVYECQNALWIWAKLIKCLTSSQLKEGPKYVGEKIKEEFPESDMIEGRPFVEELGIVTIKLSGKWIAKSIHKMLKHGIDTWAPKLPVERVRVAYPSLDEEVPMDLFRLLPIGYTLMSILEFSKVDVTIGHPMDVPRSSEWDGILAPEVLKRWFVFEEREREVVIKGEVPFILPKRDFENAYKDIFALRCGLTKHKADWMVYITPIRQQVYMETCLAAAKLEGWISSDRHKPPRATYAGYRSCTTELKEKLLDQALLCCLAVSKGEAAKFLGYSAEAVFDCVLRYTSLMNHRLGVCTFDIKMFNEKGNTFVYLLNTRAQIRRITNDYRKDIIELKKAPELILEKDKGWKKGEERVLGFHLLGFTEALEECCLCVVPHVLCEYLYDLCKKFDSYHSSVCKDGSVVETSALLLYEATVVVMEKCFHLLGITPAVVMEKCFHFLGITPTSPLFVSSLTQLLSRLLFCTVERPIDADARDPSRNSRFEMFSLRARPLTPFCRYAQKGDLFGLISVSDKFVPSRSHLFEPEVAHVALFNHDWRHPITCHDLGLVYPGNPDSGHPVSLSYFIEICTELYETNNNECYQLYNGKNEIDLASFWGKGSEGACGNLVVVSEHGTTEMYYMLLRDAVDTALKVEFETKPDTPAREVRGYIQAYYGDEFLYQSRSKSICKQSYMALLFRAAPWYELKAGDIPLIKSFLAVPTKGSLIIKAYFQDVNSEEVLMEDTCNFKPLLEGCSGGTIKGSQDFSLKLEVRWNYQNRYV